MDSRLQQFALLDALLTDWDTIRLRLGPLSVALENEFARIGAALASAPSSDEIAFFIDDLSDLTLETPAHDYVRELLQRNQAMDVTSTSSASRGSVLDSPPDELMSGALADAEQRASRAFGTELAVKGLFIEGAMRIYYATNREPVKDKSEQEYTGTFAANLSYGRVDVSIPLARHRVGELEKRPFWAPWHDKSDKERYVVIAEHTRFGDATHFGTQLSSELRGAGKHELLIFLHGYKVTFEQAAQRAAQFAFDLNFSGAVVLYSWPSLGKLLGYTVDEDRAAASAALLSQFLRGLEGGPWKRVHLLAHSMGNRVVTAALAGANPPQLPLASVILVAADVEQSLFEQQLPALADTLVRTGGAPLTSYVSRNDRALLLSRMLHRAERIGHISTQPFVRDRMETIDATHTDTSLIRVLGHSYFGDERSMLTDLRTLLADGFPAERRGGLVRAVLQGDQVAGSGRKNYWIFPR
jgi:esterase/lipase superfamily enzyme